MTRAWAALGLAFAIGALCATAQQPSPVPDPNRPLPFWSWDTIPLAYHGANTTGLFSEAAVDQLAKYRMVTIEKWYTPCAQPGPGGSQGNASCDVEASMFDTFRALRTLNPNITNILYLNSMMNFDFYHLNGVIQVRAAGCVRSNSLAIPAYSNRRSRQRGSTACCGT